MKRRRPSVPPLPEALRFSGLSDRDIRRGVERLVQQARNLDGTRAPRKHHVVPASYLERWSVEGQIRATDISVGKSFLIAPRKAARETDFYRVESEDLDRELVPPLLFEKILSEVEGAAVPAFDAAISMIPTRFSRLAAVNLASFIAFQLARGHRSRSRSEQLVNSTFVEMYRHVNEEGMRAHLGGDPSPEELASALEFVEGLRSGEYYVAEQQAAAVWRIGEMAEQCLPHLLERDWHVVSTAAELVLTDEPVLLLGGPGWPRGQQPGLNTARVIAMPLSPRRLLILTSHDTVDVGQFDAELSATETEELNLELLANAHRWQFSTPQRGGRLPALPPPVPASVIERGIEIADEPGGELLHWFSPNRWLYAPATPWPVKRWWDGQAPTHSPSPTAFVKGRSAVIRDGHSPR
jgi:hypothetical protein